MQKPTHIIGKQHIQLTIDRELDAFAIQQEVSWILKEKILPRLNEIFDNIVSDHQILRIDTLKLDLGDIDPENLEAELTNRLLEEISYSLNENKHRLTENHRPGIIHLSPEEEILEIWDWFLKKGTLPWWKNHFVMDEFESELISAIKKHPKKLKAILSSLSKNESGQKRLLWQFSSTVWEEILQQTLQDTFSEFQKLKKVFFYNLPDFFRKEKVQLSIDQNYLWQIVFSHLPKVQINQNFFKEISKDWVVFFKNKSRRSYLELERSIKQIIETSDIQLSPFVFNSLNEAIQIKIKTEAKRKDHSQETEEELLKINDQSKSEKPKKDNNKNLNHNLDELGKNYLDESEIEGIFVNNAGLVILNPFLPGLFEELGYLDNKNFKSTETQFRAAHLLQYLSSGVFDAPEFSMILNKFLCGIPLNAPLPKEIDLSKKEIEEAEHLLNVVIDYWKALKSTTPDGLRYNFFMREGKITSKEGSWKIIVEQKPQDVLLKQLPWGVAMIQYNWMKDLLTVEWNY